jgi:cytosine/adenosine deaminase-related metal-dependent hydrolase
MSVMSTQISAGRVLSHPGRKPALAASTIRIEGGSITTVSPAEAADDGLLLLPALIDAHDHGRGQRSFAIGAGDQPLELWLPLLAQEPRVDPYLRAAVSFARNARGGIAAVNHCHNPQRVTALVDEARGVARAAHDVGIRVAFAVPLRDRNHITYGDPAPIAAALGPEDFKELTASIVQVPITEQLARVDAIAGFEHPLFQVQYGPVAPQWCSDELIAEIAQASARWGRRVHMHLLETHRQREWADAQYPGGLIRRLDEMGLLSERLTVAHGVWLRPDECELLAARGVTVSVNTSSNLRLGSGFPSVALFKSKRLAWAMGLDGMAFDDDEDAMRELRLLWRCQQGTEIDGAITREELCEAAFVAGRRTITAVPGGSIETGMAADLLQLDYRSMVTDLLEGAASELEIVLARGRKEHVRALMVAGRMIVDNGAVCSVDLPALESELLAQARAAWPPAPAQADLRQRYHTALNDFYRCGCHRQLTP